MNQLATILMQTGGSQWSSLLMILGLVVVFYFFMIRPQQKQQKQIKNARAAMKKGDKVVTAGGIHGKIHEITDNYVSVEVAPNVQIRINKESLYPAGTPEEVKNK